MNKALIQDALDELRPALSSDGFDLRLSDTQRPDGIEIILEATDAACRDCLVPDDMLVNIIQTALRSRDPAAGPVMLKKVGF